jgi:hypothetical protein
MSGLDWKLAGLARLCWVMPVGPRRNENEKGKLGRLQGFSPKPKSRVNVSLFLQIFLYFQNSLNQIKI